MADSAPDPKVEDVLSSVRRLVASEMQRKTSRPAKPVSEALVLTEALRVPEKPKTPETAEAPEKPEGSKRSLEERIAELEAAVDRGSEEFEPDGSEDPSQHRPDRIVYTRPPKSDAEPDRSTLRLSQIALIETGPAAEDTSQDSGNTVPFRRETSRPVAEAPMAEDVPSLPTGGEVRAFSNPDEVVDQIEARIARGGAEGEVGNAGKDAAQAPVPEENLLRSEPEFDTALTEAVAASVTSAEADNAAAPGDFLDQDEVLAYVEPERNEEPASDAPEDKASTVADAAGDGAEKVEAEKTEAVDSKDDSPAASAVAALDAIGDEEALRLLVSRLIREELQGQLGERITRNVRKLVRREIMRALDARDLM